MITEEKLIGKRDSAKFWIVIGGGNSPEESTAEKRCNRFSKVAKEMMEDFSVAPSRYYESNLLIRSEYEMGCVSNKRREENGRTSWERWKEA